MNLTDPNRLWRRRFMRPPEVTIEQIIQAGSHLEENGKRVTGSSLRTRIGSGNPARLLKVWNETPLSTRFGTVTTQERSRVSKGSPSEGPEGLQNNNSTSSAVPLGEQLVEALKLLAASQHSEEALTAKLHHCQVVTDAVTDELNRTKLRCAELEGREKLHQERIAELHSRVDEQRGELHRGSQARIALQNALEALIGREKTD